MHRVWPRPGGGKEVAEQVGLGAYFLFSRWEGRAVLVRKGNRIWGHFWTHGAGVGLGGGPVPSLSWWPLGTRGAGGVRLWA